MILTGRDIKWYIEKDLLKIDPVDEEQFRENGLDMKLSILEPAYDLYDESYKHTLIHGHSHLLTTIEYMEVPNDLMGFVELRSTWARKGLILPPTIIDAGFKGTITLEVFNGGKDIEIPFGQRFAHIIFSKLTSPAIPYIGKYQNQKGITKAVEDI